MQTTLNASNCLWSSSSMTCGLVSSDWSGNASINSVTALARTMLLATYDIPTAPVKLLFTIQLQHSSTGKTVIHKPITTRQHQSNCYSQTNYNTAAPVKLLFTNQLQHSSTGQTFFYNPITTQQHRSNFFYNPITTRQHRSNCYSQTRQLSSLSKMARLLRLTLNNTNKMHVLRSPN